MNQFFTQLYSFLLYVQSKNLAVSGGGQVVLLAYLATLTFNRLTTYISLFSTTQETLLQTVPTYVCPCGFSFHLRDQYLTF